MRSVEIVVTERLLGIPQESPDLSGSFLLLGVQRPLDRVHAIFGIGDQVDGVFADLRLIGDVSCRELANWRGSSGLAALRNRGWRIRSSRPPRRRRGSTLGIYRWSLHGIRRCGG